MNQASLTNGKPRLVAERPEEGALARGAEGVRRSFGGASISISVAALEFAAMALTSFTALLLYHEMVIFGIADKAFYGISSVVFAALLVVAMAASHQYRLRSLEAPVSSVRQGLKYFNIVFAVFVCGLFLTRATDYYSRGGLIAQYGAGAVMLVFLRAGLAHVVAGAFRDGRVRAQQVMLIGTSESLGRFSREHDLSAHGVRVMNAFALRAPAGAEGAERGEIDRVVAEIEQACRRACPDEIVVTLPWSAMPLAEEIAYRLSIVPVTVRFSPEANAPWFRPANMAEIGTATTVQLARHPLTLVDCFAKRAFDIVFASAVLLAAGPLLLVIAALIKLDTRGPVLFRQQRHGFNNNPFRIYKFRTMTTLDDGPVVRQAQRNDARITRVGAVLRRTNLDELPQILNVLRGEMSLVGPRPHALAHNHEYEKLIALYARRHNVKPGITGWAQVQGFRGETDTIDKMQKRVECDLFYIDNWSLMLDLKILFLTVFSSKAFRNAY